MTSGVEQPSGAVVAHRFNKEALSNHRIQEANGAPKENIKELVGCGVSSPGLTVRIVDPETKEAMPPDKVGEIWVSGPSVARGYWKKPEVNKEIFQAKIVGENGTTYMRTGDLGFIYDDQIFITGRIKNVIIIDGKNHYPQDIEWTVERAHPALKTGGAAAFPISAEDTEKLVIVAEVDRRTLREMKKEDENIAKTIIRKIKATVSNIHNLGVADIRLITDRIPKTTSGKIRHHLVRDNYLTGVYDGQVPT